MLYPHTPIKLPEETQPQLIVVIDTEEEFDWNAPPDRNATGVSHMDYIYRVQDIFNDYHITPCYVIDYPIASQEQGYAPLLEYYQNQQCEIGAHLHPWVNPPTKETLSAENTYPGNLPYELEFAKLQQLQHTIAEVFGFNPNIYKAGRYGLGANTPDILSTLGFDIDLSVCTAYDYHQDGGPDYSHADASPSWFGEQRSLLEIPLSGAFTGISGAFAPNIFNLAKQLSAIKMPGILSRLNIVDRLMLSPEGYTPEEHKKLSRFLYNQGIRIFTWNFHSPSVVPGFTQYTNNQKELNHFLDSFRYFFDFFLEDMQGKASTPLQIKQQLETH